MACSKWEETGLLYSSRELGEKETGDYKDHLEVCEKCRNEHEHYQKECGGLYTPEILGEEPSKAIDQEILRVCGSARKKVTHLNLFPMFIRKSAYSVMFFLVGFIVVGYFAIHKENANRARDAFVLESAKDSMALAGAALAAQQPASPADSAALDSSSDTNVHYTKMRGNMGLKGVYPVDLQQK